MANITVKKALIGATDISWGTGTFVRQKSDGTYMNVNQVYAASIPIEDSANYYTWDTVELALQTCGGRNQQLSSSVNALSSSINALSASYGTRASTITDLMKTTYKGPAGPILNTSGTRVIFPIGYYPVGDKIYNISSTVGWSPVRFGASSFNLGMDYGTVNVQSTPTSKWVYFYAVPPRFKSAGTPCFIASGTFPTKKFNNSNIGFGYDSTNTYLGSAKFDAASVLCNFRQSGNRTDIKWLNFYANNLRSSSITNYYPKVVDFPRTADIGVMDIVTDISTGLGTNDIEILVYDNQQEQIFHDRSQCYAAQGFRSKMVSFGLDVKDSAANTPNIVYLKETDSTNASLIFASKGWYDKYC